MRFKAEFLQKFEIWVGRGEQIWERFGMNRCKKSGWLKTGLRRDVGRRLWVPEKSTSKQDISDSHMNGPNTACVPSGTVPDIYME